MTRKTTLRAVGADEKPVKPKTLAEAIESGTYVEQLVAQRNDIVADLPSEKGPAKAALHRQLTLLNREIEALRVKGAEDTEGGADVDDEEFDATAI
jgi:hypothetical protein